MALTQIVSMDGSRTPLMMEVPVAPELDGPFLVSSSRDFLWIAKVFPNGMVRTAVRRIARGDLFREALQRITAHSQESRWGSVQPATREGAKAVVLYLADFDLLNIEVLYGAGFDPDIIESDIPCRKVGWVPDGWATILPMDRAFVGTTIDFGEGQHALLVHNASRGVGVLLPSVS